VSLPGEYKATGRDLDLAINGRGFFVLNNDLGGAGETFFGRDGSLYVTTEGQETAVGIDGQPISVGRGYLVDKNGYFVQGWAAAADGTFPAGARLGSLRVDPYAFQSVGQPTSNASLALNLPADSDVGGVETYDIDIFDSAAVQRAMELSFTKQSANSWAFSVDGTAVGTLQFDSTGKLTAPFEYQITTSYPDNPNTTAANDAATAEFTLDLSGLTRFSGDFVAFDYTRDGYADGALTDFHFDEQGDVVGVFDNGRTRPLYRLALADFVNPDGLKQTSGNVFVEGGDSGPPVLGSAGEAGLGRISSSTLEQSNVDLAGEFSRMILTQNAYNSSATAFKTLDEMSEVARDLM
jgi:flagellar hook protein FlgE